MQKKYIFKLSGRQRQVKHMGGIEAVPSLVALSLRQPTYQIYYQEPDKQWGRKRKDDSSNAIVIFCWIIGM